MRTLHIWQDPTTYTGATTGLCGVQDGPNHNAYTYLPNGPDRGYKACKECLELHDLHKLANLNI